MNKKVLFLLQTIFAVLMLILFVFATNWYLNKKVSYQNNLFVPKPLIVYYSHSNHTEDIANMIKQHLNCDIEKIKAEEYEGMNVLELTNMVIEQTKKDYLPKTNKIDMSDYDVIFIGSPVWKGDLSLPVKSFLISNDFNGKTIIPFYTFAGMVDKAKLDRKIKELSNNDNVLPSFLTVPYKFAFIEHRLTRWLNRIKNYDFYNMLISNLPDDIIERFETFRKLRLSQDDAFYFKDNFLKVKYPNGDFLYEFEFALFLNGYYSPEEIQYIITQGTKHNVHSAYALKSLFYEMGGLDVTREQAIEYITKAILMEPNNISYKRILNNIKSNVPNFSFSWTD
ncbi:MAG: hypothetical protein K6A44_03585 [bacterium]|nr:hypothetical protein [bacterium]